MSYFVLALHEKHVFYGVVPAGGVYNEKERKLHLKEQKTTESEGGQDRGMDWCVKHKKKLLTN